MRTNSTITIPEARKILMFNGNAICNPLIGFEVISDVSKNGAIDSDNTPVINPLNDPKVIVKINRIAFNLLSWNTSNKIPILNISKK